MGSVQPVTSVNRGGALCVKAWPGPTGECVLTSWHGLRGAWTSSPRGNPGRQGTCYDGVWEQTRVQHLSSCQLRHKLWIMNITEVMGLWDSFIALTNRISPEGWGAGMRQMTYFALQKKDRWTFSTLQCDLRVTFIPRCWSRAVVLNERLSLDGGESLCEPLSGHHWGVVTQLFTKIPGFCAYSRCVDSKRRWGHWGQLSR